jgi:hypothetical protein
LRKRPLDTSEKVKQLAVREKELEDAEASAKRARVDPVAETDEDVDVLTTPQIQPCTKYPPKGSAQKMAKGPSQAVLADAGELEAREARGRRVAELIQKDIAMADTAPKERVAGLVDVVDESESLCYIDDDTARPEKDPDVSLPQPQCEVAMNLNEGSGAKPRDLIDLDASEVEASVAHASRSPPPVSQDLDLAAAKPTEAAAPEKLTAPDSLQPEDAGMSLLLGDKIFMFFLSNMCFVCLRFLLSYYSWQRKLWSP